MKILNSLFALLLLVLLTGTDRFIMPAMAIRGAQHAVRIPEHTCHKQLLDSSKSCELQLCMQDCSKESSYGVGECRDAICTCTYFCKQPPLV